MNPMALRPQTCMRNTIDDVRHVAIPFEGVQITPGVKGKRMGRHYSTRDFFRQMPNRLLARYFAARGVLAEVNFAGLKETKIEPLFAAWLELTEDERKAMDAELLEISEMSSEKGFRAILDEAKWQLRETPEKHAELVEKLAALANHYERAMVTFLEHPQFWRVATHFFHADSLSYWRKRKGFPHQPASVHEDGRQVLAESIRNYFHRTEGRGNNCVVETFRRGELDYFFAYPEDYSQQSIEWVNGKFGRRPHNPAFEVIFVYSQGDGTLDLNYRGSRETVEPLQEMFITAILKLPEIPPDPEDTRIYDLNPLRVRGFQFHYDRNTGIEGVVLRRIRLESKVVRGDRITLEADTSSNAECIYDLIEKIEKSVSPRLYTVTQVEIAAKVAVEADRRPKTVSFRITLPNSCTLKYDDAGIGLRKMLVASGIEPKERSQDLSPEETESAEA